MLATALLVLSVLCPYPSNDVPDELQETHLFGLQRGSAWPLAKAALEHPDVMRGMVVGCNSAETVAAWEAECQKRFEIWNHLSIALDGKGYFWMLTNPCGEGKYVFFDTWTVQERKFHLAELRSELGDEAYLAGFIPKHTPSYRPWSN